MDKRMTSCRSFGHCWLLAAMACLVMVSLWLPGCGTKGDAQSLDVFRQRWFDAVNNQDGQALYQMLDAASKRWIASELDQLRGLDSETQKKVLDQLGGQRASNLMDFTAGQYFDLLWEQATQGRRPTMKIVAAGAQTAYITLSMADTKPQRVRLTIQGGHWVWELPETQFSVRAEELKQSQPSITPPTD